MWADYDARAGIAYKIFKSAAETNRFGARYRLAKAFRTMELDGYSDATAQGYEALTRLMFAWGAFEGLLKAIGHNHHQITEISKSYSYAGMLKDLREADPDSRFFKFVHTRLDNKNLQAEVKRFVDGHICCGITLARGARHIFVHGPLTPSANQADPAAVVGVCNRLTTCLFRVMDREFRNRVEQLVILAPPMEHPPDDSYPF
jgi:hypothetical protein